VGISQPAGSQCLHAVTKILVSKRGDFIKFPTENDIQAAKIGFASLAAFPNVIGAVDGTHINLQVPRGDDEPLFVCRKGGHSLNVQVTCDREMRLTSVVAKFPGSTHDSFIWRNCNLKEQFASNPPNGWLLGDSGYGLEPWLITPLLDPTTQKEKNFNRSLKKTRFIVENAIGLWKSVFRCIDKTGGYLLYSPRKVCNIVLATAVLHNIRRNLKLPEDETFTAAEEDDSENDIDPNLEENAITLEGHRVRNKIIQTHF